MADRKISDLTALTTPATGDLIPIVDISEAAAADKNKSITVGELLRGAPDGTAAAPGIAFESDGGNGMFLGGTDILAFSTGGTQAVTIDASQRLGVGTTSPGFAIDVQKSGTNPAISLNRTDAATAGSITLASGNANNYLDNGGTKDFTINTSSTERLRIDSSGRVGIGTSSPSVKLHVANGSAQQAGTQKDCARFIASTASPVNSGGLTIGAVWHNTDINQRIAYLQSEQGLDPGSTARFLSLNPDGGNVGIGTTSPGHSLAVRGAGSNTDIANFFGGTVGRGLVIGTDNDGGTGDDTVIYNATQSSGSHVFEVDADEKVRIDSSGRLLVGTSSSIRDNAILQIKDDSGQSEIWFEHSGLANTEFCRYIAVDNTASRSGQVGLFKHSGISAPAGFLYIQPSDGADRWYWTDDSDNFRSSALSSHIGTTNGSVVGTQTSDERLKNVGANVSYGLTEVLQLQPKQYALKSEPDTNKLGFIAQEVESVIPEAVFDTGEELEGHQEGDRTKLGMEYVQLIPVLVNAIKEQQATIADLQTRLAALEAN